MKRFQKLMGLMLALVVLAGCGGQTKAPSGAAQPAAKESPAPAKKEEPVKVKMSWGKVFQQTHWGDIAQHLDSSVQVEIMDFKTTNDQLFALQAGSLDFSVMGYNQLASALVQGPVEATVIAGLSNAPTRLVSRKGLEIKDWSDLKGKKIGGARGSTQYMQISIAMKKHGVDVNKDIEFVQFKGAPEMLVGLQQGAVDAIMIWEPQASQAIVDGFGQDTEVVAKTLYKDSFSSGNAIVVSNKFLKAHPDVVQKMVNAYYKSYQKVTSDQKYWKETFNKMTGMDMKVLDVAASNAKPEYWMPVDEIRMITETMHGLGFLEKNVTDQVLGKLDYSFLEKATGKSKSELGGK
ncbi:MAG: ABC transporter substrate-binding protein [Bacillota bacterium]